jgi:hypothetical protein
MFRLSLLLEVITFEVCLRIVSSIVVVATIDETFFSQTSKVIATSNNDRRNIPQANLKSYNHGLPEECFVYRCYLWL